MKNSRSMGIVQAFAVALCAASLAGCGDVVFESDPCKYQLDQHSVQFHTYQSASWGQAECDEIPATGVASLSVVYPDKELRGMRAKLQVYAADSWAEARSLDPSTKSTSVLSVPEQVYPSGVIAVNHDFRQPGYFVNVLTLASERGTVQVIKFPFRVAMATNNNVGLSLLAMVGVAIAALGFFKLRARQTMLARARIANLPTEA